MKILIMSDSHGNNRAMIDAVTIESPELILHLGDCDSDCSGLINRFPDITLRSVRGNCDPWSNGPDVCDFRIGEKHFFMTHGHLHRVKSGIRAIVDSTFKRGADVLLFGHTHIPHCEIGDKLAVINPGSIGVGEKTYAVLNLSDGAIRCVIKNLS